MVAVVIGEVVVVEVLLGAWFLLVVEEVVVGA